MPSNQTLVIYLKDEDFKQKLKKFASENNQSVSDYVYKILSSELKKKKSNSLKKYSGKLNFLDEKEIREIDNGMKNFRNSLKIDF